MSVIRKLVKPGIHLTRCLSNHVVYSHDRGIGIPDHPHDTLPLSKIFIESLEKYSANPCLVNVVNGRTRTYGQVLDHSLRCAWKLRASGVRAGDHVMLYSTNLEDWATSLIALISVGAVPCLANPGYTEFELASLCALCDVKFIVCCDSNLEVAKSVSSRAGIPILFSVDHLTEWIAGTEPITKVSECEPHSTAVICFSSGTTGLPKGVELSHFALTKQRQLLDHPLITAIDFGVPMIGLLPFYHAFGLNALNIGMNSGSVVNVFPYFDPAKYLELIQEHKISQLTLVPPLILFLVKHPMVANFDLSSVRTIYTGAAPLSASLINDLKETVPSIDDVRQGYGMSEMTCAATFQLKGCTTSGSVGSLLPQITARIVDPDTDEAVSEGQPGEILLKGPSRMNGYYNNPQATAGTIGSDGWLRTGDVARRDEKGLFWIVDRLKEMIKVKGLQVAPAELEAVLTTHPLISDAAVIAIPDGKSGQAPKAFVTKVPGAQLSDADVKSFIAAKLSQHKHLAEVEFLDEIPKLPSGKILRKDLRSADAAKRV